MLINCFFYLLLVLVTFSAQCVEKSNWHHYPIQDEPFVMNIGTSDEHQVFIIENKTVDSFAKFSINNTVNYSASWMSEGGRYVVYIPLNSGNVKLEIDKVVPSNIKEYFRIKALEINQEDKHLISGLTKFSKVIDLRFKNYLKKIKTDTQAMQMLYESSLAFITSGNEFLTALSHFESAELQYELSQHLIASQLFKTSHEFWQKINAPLQTNITLNRYGLELWRSHQYQRGITVFHKVLKNSQEHQRLFRAQAHNNIGLIHLDSQELMLAKNHFIQALQIFGFDQMININILDIFQLIKKINHSDNRKDILLMIHNLALTHFSLGSPQKSKKLLTVFSNDSSDSIDYKSRIITNHSLGVNLRAQGKYQQAKYHLDVSLRLLEKYKYKYKRWYFLNYYYLGEIAIDLGLYHLAEIQFKKASIHTDVLNSPKNYIDLQYKLSQVHRLKKNYNLSLNISNAAFEIAKRLKRLRVLALLHINKHHIYLSQNMLHHAQKELELALVVLEIKPFGRLRSRINILKANILIKTGKIDQAIALLSKEVINLKNIWDTQLLNDANNMLAMAYLENNNYPMAQETITNEIQNLKFYLKSSNSEKIQQSLGQMLKETVNIFAQINTKIGKTERGFVKINQMLDRFNKTKPSFIKNTKKDTDFNADLLGQIESKSVALENNDLSENDRNQIQDEII